MEHGRRNNGKRSLNDHWFFNVFIFFAIVGCVLYGRKLIRTEKVDAVFGNPERAKGGIHWVIVGSSFFY